MQRTITMEQATAEVREWVRGELDFEEAYGEKDLRSLVTRRVSSLGRERRWTSDDRMGVVDRVLATFTGLDILEPLMSDADVTEIMVNGHEDVFFEKEGKLYKYPLRFDSRERLEDIIQSIVGKVNRIVNEANPIVDARLPDGSRVSAVLPPVALRGPILTIRKFAARPITLEQLVRRGALTAEAADALRSAVVSRRNVFICGGTGSGKTTLLNALAQSIPDGERVVTIEDSAELQLTSVANLVSLETRIANTEGKGEITIRQLLRAALRMRPNRIIVGEVRGAEALDMLQAMNTGHEGSLSTGHANTVRDMLSRLETMAVSGADLPLAAVRQQIASALHVVVHLSRMADFTRKVTEITAVEGLRDGEYVLRPLFAWRHDVGGGALARADGGVKE